MNLLMMELLPTDWSPMKTILNLIVCFLFVAQLISSSYLLIQSNYQLSEQTYSINRMDLYQMKYENIADRIKRLAASPTTTTPQIGTNQNGMSFRQKGNNNVARRDNPAPDLEGRNKYLQAYKYSKTTMDTDYSADQQSNPISTRNLQKENLSPSIKDRKMPYERSTEYQSTLTKERDQEVRMASRREEVQLTEISKVKSESTLKMEEIMESFNNYKHNKDKFISSIGKYSHSRTETEPNYKKENNELHVRPKEQTRIIFNEIDNIWNDEKPFQQKITHFQRSKKVKCNLEDLTDILNETVQSQEVAKNMPKDFCRPKLIIKNFNNEQSLITEKLSMRTIVSPRGVRAPGKICKNITKQDTSFGRERY